MGNRVFTQIFGVVGGILERDGKILLVREARGTAKMHWLSLLGGKESQYENPANFDLVSCLVSIYNHTRTYFSNNPG